MKKSFVLFCYILSIFILYNCGGDDNGGDSEMGNSFFDGALTSASNEQLEGRWSIFQVRFEGQITNVQSNFPECGRDFFDFLNQGSYREYIFNDDFECTPEINMLNWNLSNGIINVTNGSATDKWVITELNSDRLVFKFRLDVDADGDLEIFEAICSRYEPPMEMDIYSGTFRWDNTIDSLDKILLVWDEYIGYNNFVSYEIYRFDEGCSYGSEELISTITDVQENSFIDETAPPYENICYKIKIYTNQGLLGESPAITVSTDSIRVPNTILLEPTLNGNTIELNWEQYQGYYFSHYEIEVRNYSSGSGGGFQEEQFATINNLETTQVSLPLPYFANPVFVIRVFNIFGERSQYTIEGENQRSTNFVRNEILPFNRINYPIFDDEDTFVYFVSNLAGSLHKYNYATNNIDFSVSLNTGSIDAVKLINSEYGKEIAISAGSIYIYNAENLQFKYELDQNNTNFSLEHFEVTEDGYWLATDRENLYSFTRDESTLNHINTNTLYNQSFSVSRINVMDLKQNRILIGNYIQPQGLIVGIFPNGELATDSVPVELNATSRWSNNSLFSESEQYVLNIEGNTIYSTNTYDLITTLDSEYFPSGISNNGELILGTNNSTVTNGFHEKKVRILNYPSLSEQVYDSKGYPNIVHQNHLGQIVSISKGLVGHIETSSQENDIFIEIIE